MGAVNSSGRPTTAEPRTGPSESADTAPTYASQPPMRMERNVSFVFMTQLHSRKVANVSCRIHGVAHVGQELPRAYSRAAPLLRLSRACGDQLIDKAGRHVTRSF